MDRTKRLFVNGLPYHVTGEILENFILAYGAVESVTVMIDNLAASLLFFYPRSNDLVTPGGNIMGGWPGVLPRTFTSRLPYWAGSFSLPSPSGG